MDDIWWLDALREPAGQRLLAELAIEPLTVESELRVITRFRECYPADLVSAALVQTKLRARARAKFSLADQMFFTRAGLEQASTERMAQHHARRFAPFGEMADLCSGIGGDLIAFASDRDVLAVDSDPVHARLGIVNAEIAGVGRRARSACADVRTINVEGLPAAFVDPARRSGDRRLRGGASEPPLDWCFALAAGGVALAIKSAPGLSTELVPNGWELEFVSEGRELKESLLWSPALATTSRRATLLPGEQTLIADLGVTLAIRKPGAFLLDPDPAITRAGLVEGLGETTGECWKIDEQVAFLSSDKEFHTPFARTLRVEASMPWNLKRLREALRSLRIGTVDIRKRGSAVDVEELRRRLKLEPGRSATVVLTRVGDKPWALVCSPVARIAVLDLNSESA